MTAQIIIGDALEKLRELPDESVHCCVTSPPYYGLRDYGHAGQIGLEETPEAYVASLVAVFREVRRVLREDGTLWLNLGDSYNAAGRVGQGTREGCKQGTNRASAAAADTCRATAPGLKPKDLIGIPWSVAFALRADGWYLRQEIIWHKPNPMPESVQDRCTKSHEHVFLLAKSERYHFDAKAIMEPVSEVSLKRAEYGWHCDRPSTKNNALGDGVGIHTEKMGTRFVNPNGRNKRSVWTVNTQPYTNWVETVRWVRVSKDAVCDGMTRIACEDCPVHGGSDRQDDERAADLQPHSHDTCGHPVQEQPGEPTSNSMNLGSQNPSCSSDLKGQPCSETATPRSSQSRKTARAPSTTASCIASARMIPRTDDKPESLGSCDLVAHTTESKIWPDEMDDHQMARMACYTADKSSLVRCLCQFYKKSTKKTSHFATFPPKLIEPCILAGCPEGGVVLDPFAGSGTTGMVALTHRRSAILIDLNPANEPLMRERLRLQPNLF